MRQSATALQLHQHSIIFSGISSQLLTYGLKPQKVLMRVRSVSSLLFRLTRSPIPRVFSMRGRMSFEKIAKTQYSDIINTGKATFLWI